MAAGFPAVLRPSAAGVDIGARDLRGCSRGPLILSRFVPMPPSLKICTGPADWLPSPMRYPGRCHGIHWRLLDSAVSRFWKHAAWRSAWSMPGITKTCPERRDLTLSDCQWLQYLHAVGLLRASFRPEQQVCALRSLPAAPGELDWHCFRAGSSRAKSTRSNEPADPPCHQRRNRADGPIDSGCDSRRRARSDGTGEAEGSTSKSNPESDHRKILGWRLPAGARVHVATSHWPPIVTSSGRLPNATRIEVEKLLCQFDARIDVEASPLAPPKVRRKKLYSNEPSFDLRQHLYRIFGVDLTAVPGINVHDCTLPAGRSRTRPFEIPQRLGLRVVDGTMPGQRHQRRENSVGADPKGLQRRAPLAFRMAANALFPKANPGLGHTTAACAPDWEPPKPSRRRLINWLGLSITCLQLDSPTTSQSSLNTNRLREHAPKQDSGHKPKNFPAFNCLPV